MIALARVKGGTVVCKEKPTPNIAKPRIPVCDALGVHCLTHDGVHRSPGTKVLSVCEAARIAHSFGSVPRTCQDRSDRLDRATQTGHADFADLE